MSPNDGAYYAETVEQFLADAESVETLTERLVAAHTEQQPERVLSEEQLGAWKSEIIFLKKFIDAPELHDAAIALEMKTGHTNGRIDAVLCGRNEGNKPRFVLLEFKTWHTRRRHCRRYEVWPYHTAETKALLVNLFSYDSDALVFARVSTSVEDDPRTQVERYRRQVLEALSEAYEGRYESSVHAAVVLYNCAKLSETSRTALNYVNPPDGVVAQTIPLYTIQGENGAHSIEGLRDFLIVQLRGGDGKRVCDQLLSVLAQ